MVDEDVEEGEGVDRVQGKLVVVDGRLLSSAAGIFKKKSEKC